MAFLNKIDYKDAIRESLLDDITEIDDEIIDMCEARAIGFIESYLNNRYDTVNIFNKTGNDRNPFILGITKDVTIFYMHRLNNWRKIPAARIEAYAEAKEWLQKVNGLQVNPRDLPLMEDGSKNYILYGSNPKRNNHI